MEDQRKNPFKIGDRVRRAATGDEGVVVSVEGDFCDVTVPSATVSVHYEDLTAVALRPDELFDELKRFTAELTEEEQRGMRDGLTEEELVVFDLLTKPDPELTTSQEVDVKKIVRELLKKLKTEQLVLDWRKRQQTRAGVRLTIEETLDDLPEVYDRPLYARKCDVVNQHVYDSYYGAGQSAYAVAN